MATAQDLKDYIDANLPSNAASKMLLLRTVLKQLIDDLFTSLGVGGSLTEVKDIVIELGQIQSDAIHVFINANDSADWNLIADTSYIFQCVKDGFRETYKYIGSKPKYLGLSQTAAVVGDFQLLHTGRLRMESAWVEKLNSNNSLVAIEGGDKVYFKTVDDGGNNVVLFGHTYDSGNNTLRASYTQNQSFDI